MLVVGFVSGNRIGDKVDSTPGEVCQRPLVTRQAILEAWPLPAHTRRPFYVAEHIFVIICLLMPADERLSILPRDNHLSPDAR